MNVIAPIIFCAVLDTFDVEVDVVPDVPLKITVEITDHFIATVKTIKRRPIHSTVFC